MVAVQEYTLGWNLLHLRGATNGCIDIAYPLNNACRKMDRKQDQIVSAACNCKRISLLHYKLAACIEVAAAYASQTCPLCGERSKHRRLYPLLVWMRSTPR